nr:antibiotic biosynthesis monooxygenase family protein [Hyphomonas sp. Mor2]
MIRVIYRWRVDPERLDEFSEAWRRTTRAIHASTPGARGSFGLQSIEAPDEVLTIALWETEAQWRAFIETARSGSMRAMHEIATQLSATAYHQIGDETVSG